MASNTFFPGLQTFLISSLNPGLDVWGYLPSKLCDKYFMRGEAKRYHYPVIGLLLFDMQPRIKRSLGFAVLRSEDGVSWNNLGFVNSQAVNGNSNTRLSYNFTDQQPVSGMNYYQLQQIDEDGKSKYSSILSVDFDNAVSGLRIYPSPAGSSVTLSGLKGISTIRIINIMGQVIHASVTSGESIRQVNISGLSKGIYYLQITGRDKVTVTQKLIKQ